MLICCETEKIKLTLTTLLNCNKKKKKQSEKIFLKANVRKIFFGIRGGEPMTDKQRRFADEYIIDCNATRASKAAYPRIKSYDPARANASRLLTNANVKAYIEAKLDELSSKKIAEEQEVMEYLTAVMRGDSTASVVVVEGQGDGCSAAKVLDKPPDEKERLKAAELLGKRFSLFKDGIEVSVNAPQIIDDIGGG